MSTQRTHSALRRFSFLVMVAVCVLLFIANVWSAIDDRAPAPLVDPGRYLPVPERVSRWKSQFQAWAAERGWWQKAYASEPSRWRQVQNNMKCIAYGLQMHATQHGALPPAQAALDGSVNPVSWRVRVLPFQDELARWKAWDHALPWDQQTSRLLSGNAPTQFARWEDSPFTRCVAVTGPGTCWPDDGTQRIEDIHDDWGKTILLIEYPFEDIHWTQPRDLMLDEALRIYSQPTLPDIDYIRDSGGVPAVRSIVAVAFVDGSIKHLPLGLPRETLRALFTINGGEDVDVP